MSFISGASEGLTPVVSSNFFKAAFIDVPGMVPISKTVIPLNPSQSLLPTAWLCKEVLSTNCNKCDNNDTFVTKQSSTKVINHHKTYLIRKPFTILVCLVLLKQYIHLFEFHLMKIYK